MKKIIEYIKDVQLEEQKDRFFKILNMRSNQLCNNVHDKLNIDDKAKQWNYSLLSILNIPFTSHTMSTLLYDIVKLSKEFADSCIMIIKHPQGSKSKVINISK